jgi:very-short-patch-repair endonuclease
MRARSTGLVERGLARLASSQHGVVSRRQLLDLGFERGAVARRIEAGRLTRVHAGVYLVGHVARAPLATEMAAVLACGQGAALSHRSAAVLWGLVARPNGHVEAEVTVSRSWAPDRPGIRVHRRPGLMARDIALLDGLPTTGPARTLLDLGSRFRLEELEAAAAQAERRHGIGLEALTDQLDRNRNRVGAATLRSLVERVERPSLTRSSAERRLLRLLRAAGIPIPETNQMVAGLEVDLLWRAAHVAVEFDGFGFHADRAAFERDRVRDAELQARGYRVIRVTWRQLVDHPQAVVSRIRRVLAFHRQRGG